MAETIGAAPEGQAEEIANNALEKAALLHRFDPFDLLPSNLAPDIEAQALARIARYATETELPMEERGGAPEAQGKTLWRLTPEARRRELSRFTAKNASAAAREAALANVPADEKDIFARYLRRALLDQLDPAAVPEKDRDSAAAAANFAAAALGQEKLLQIEKSLRAKISERAEEARSSGALSGKLIGRAVESAALDAFALTGAIPEADRLPRARDPAIEIDAYLLTGPGGAGKSALIADLVRRWRSYRTDVPAPASWSNWSEVKSWAIAVGESYAGGVRSAAERLLAQTRGRPRPGRIVLLDLERLGGALAGELEWTEEVTRQIGLGLPSLSKRLSALRNKAQLERTRRDPSGKSPTARWAGAADLKEGLAEALEKERSTGALLVIFLDDFEEAIIQSFPVENHCVASTVFGRLLLWADSFAALTSASDAPVFGAVRLIAAGRSSPALENEMLARWFKGRGEIRPVDAAGSRDAEADHNLAPRAEMPALERLRAVGPLRMAAGEIARLPDAARLDAILSRMEFGRRQGWPDPRLPEMDQGETSAAGHGRGAAASSNQLFALLQDREAATRIDYAFVTGDFAAAAEIGWRAIGTISEVPDLSEPWRIPGEPTTHWIWQTALAALALDEAPEVRARIEDFLRKVALCLDPARARADAAGLMLAAAATIALGGRLSPRTVQAAEDLATTAAGLSDVRSLAELRLIALAPLWRQDRAAPSPKTRIATRRLRMFSSALLTEPAPPLELGGQAPLVAFASMARENSVSAREIDAFAASDRTAIEAIPAPDEPAARTRLADILVGLSPELYDAIVGALIEADREAGAAVNAAIGAIRATAPFWPSDVDVERIPLRDRDRRAGHIARSAIHADRCALLGVLLERASAQVETPRLSSVMRLMQRYEAARRMAYAKDEAATGSP
jgi:hypothetical protein